MSKTAFLLVAFLALFAISPAQNAPIGFLSSNSSITPDTIQPGDTIYYNLVVQNKDSISGDSITGTMQILRRIQPAPIILDTILSAVISNALFPGDTTAYAQTEIASAAKFKGGLNIIVIWPDVPNTVAVDSLIKGVIYKDSLQGIDSHISPLQLELFPNPVSDLLFVRLNSQSAQVQDAFLAETNGRIIRHFHSLPDSINLTGLPAGTYLLGVRRIDGPDEMHRIVVTR